ncbi:MAG TPA: hypothetical protein VK149_03840 [Sideroxyarcus sp.]|nr:hypothetical protein [Sideroxyarcus sp.]
MGLRDNRDMVYANIVQQGVATLLFLFVPKMLGVSSYAQVTYVSTLLTFISFADLGLSFVYGRRMPGIYARNDIEEINLWNSTILRFRLYTALVFSGLISAIYLAKYGDYFNTALLFIIPPISVAIQFFIASSTSQQQFAVTRNINIWQSLARLSTLPGVMYAGLRGWFITQLITSLAVFAKREVKLVCVQYWVGKVGISWKLIYDNLPEAIYLGLITTLWTQLLYSGKVFAVFMYPDVVIAQYGLAGAAYQVVSSLMVAAFIPQTIKAYKMLEEDQGEAVRYIFGVIVKALPIIIAAVLIGVLMAPYFFNYIFPSFHVTSQLVMPLIVSLVSYPVIVSLGSLLVGTKRNKVYLAVISIWLLIDWILVEQLTPYFGYNSAAVAQLVSLSLYSVSLLGITMTIFPDSLKQKWQAYFAGGVGLISMVLCLLLWH